MPGKRARIASAGMLYLVRNSWERLPPGPGTGGLRLVRRLAGARGLFRGIRRSAGGPFVQALQGASDEQQRCRGRSQQGKREDSTTTRRRGQLRCRWSA